MRRVALLQLLPLVWVSWAVAPPPGMAPVEPGQLAAMLQESVEQGSPGLSAAIGNCRGVIWTGVAGLTDVDARRMVDEANLFGIGSITKVFMAVIVLQLVEEGRLRLDATPAEILGEGRVRGIANADTATVADLLGHRAGVPSWEDDRRWIARGRGRDLDPAHMWGKEEALDYIRGTPAVGPAGGHFAYSNSGYTLLGLMVEKVTQHTAEAEIRRRVLVPLGLDHTFMEGFEPGHDALVPRRYQFATGKFRSDAGIAPSFVEVRPGLIDTGRTNLSGEWVAGGLISSPRDLVQFARALRDARLLKPQSLAFMEQWGAGQGRSSYGHGIFRFRVGESSLIGHTGGVLGFSAVLWWSKDSDAIVAVLGNASGVHAGPSPLKASSVGLSQEFVQLALRYAGQQSGCTKAAMNEAGQRVGSFGLVDRQQNYRSRVRG